jgi:hypothetical protein
VQAGVNSVRLNRMPATPTQVEAARIGNGDTGNFAFAGQQITPENYFTTRIDYQFRPPDLLTGSYVFDGAPTTQPDQFNLRINEITTQRNLFSFRESHTFTPNPVNVARFGVNRVVAEIGLTPTALQPIAADTSYGFLPGKTSGVINVSGLTNFTGGLGASMEPARSIQRPHLQGRCNWD